MTAERLLRLYPRAWRARYGDEFLAMVGSGPLQLQQVIDIVSGAIDAWLSAEVRGATQQTATSTGGTKMKAISICTRNQTRYTTRDGAIGGAVMMLSTLAFALTGLALRGAGYGLAATIVLNSAFTFSMTLSLPFWLMKGQPWKAQAMIIGGTILLLLSIHGLAALN
jgi:hypothetical protein